MKGSGFGLCRARFHVHRRTVPDGPGLGDAAGPQAARADCSGIGVVAGPGAPAADRGSLGAPQAAPHRHRVWTRLTVEMRRGGGRVHGACLCGPGSSRTGGPPGEGDGARKPMGWVPRPRWISGLFGGHIAGVLEPLWMFCMRLSASGRGYHEAFGNQAIESFLEGHVHAFEHFGGVPAPSWVWIRPPPTTTTTCRIGVQAIRTAPHIPLSTAALTPVNAGGHEGIGV